MLADDTGAGKRYDWFIDKGINDETSGEDSNYYSGGLTKQWQEDELGLKFNMQFKLVNRATFNATPIFSKF